MTGHLMIFKYALAYVIEYENFQI